MNYMSGKLDNCIYEDVFTKSGNVMSMEEVEAMFPGRCDDYGISLDAFIEQEEMNGS